MNTPTKFISRGCPEGVKSVSSWCQEDVKRMSRACQECVSAVSLLNGCQGGDKEVSTLSRGFQHCKEGVKRVSTPLCQEHVKRVPRGCKEHVRRVSKGC